MEIVPITKENLDKNRIEYLQKQQQEYKLLTQIKKCPGHTLFCFNTKTGEIKPAPVKNKVGLPIHCKKKNGEWELVTKTEIVIEPDCIYEQALNEKNFRKRLKRKGLL